GFTAFVSWHGTMQQQVLRSLFPEDDVQDIRHSPIKSFAHIDFNSLDALNRALKKHGLPLQNYGVIGNLRVERGRPRGNNN
ncbi:5536_t:CDS:2, partial [Ambispora gerdemannii]